MDNSLKEISLIQDRFINHCSDDNGKLHLSDERIDKYIRFVDRVYHKPNLILGSLYELAKRKNINQSFTTNFKNNVTSYFESRKITDNKSIISLLEAFVEEPRKVDNVTKNKKKIKKLIKTLKDGDEKLKSLYSTCNNSKVNININNKNSSKKDWGNFGI